MRTTLVPLGLMLAVTAWGGCNSKNYDAVETFPVTGTLQVNGVPAQGAEVRFWPNSEQPGLKYPIAPSGKVDASGRYQLTSYEGPDGAPPGDYSVTVSWPDPDWRPPGGGMPPPPPDRLMGKFSNRDKAVMEFTVVEGDNQVDPIILDDAKILKGSKLPSGGN